MTKPSPADRLVDRGAVVAAVASLIHRRVGHIDDDEGPVGGCYRAAEAVVDMVLQMLDEERSRG